MQNTTNVFLEGIITDQNPLTIPETALTSALNATVITGDGNEGLLQNDMGNTLIRDSITGNIMSLSNGFIPLGMKERGGVLYIASYNPETNEGELGTIPSPIIHYEYTALDVVNDLNYKITDIADPKYIDSEETSVAQRVNKNPLYILSDHIFHAGDKFIVVLNIDQDTDLTKRKYYDPSITRNEQNVRPRPRQIFNYPEISSDTEFPQISQINKRGWFKIKLYAISNSGEEIELSEITNSQSYYITNDNQLRESEYWFIESNKLSDNFNLNKTRTQNLFRTYPNIRSGRLAIRFEEELPGRLNWMYNDSFKKNLPQIYINSVTDDNGDLRSTCYAIAHGFRYTNGKCPICPDKIVVTCNFPMYTTEYSSSETKLSSNSISAGDELVIISNVIATNSNQFYSDSFIRPGIKYIDFPYSNNIKVLKSTNINNELLINNGEDFIISHHLYEKSDNKEYELNFSFTNYDSEENDGSFFIELTDLNKEVKVHVKTYTKAYDFNESGTYVLYDEYDLPSFIPLVELGAGNIISGYSSRQQLNITKDRVREDGYFDLHLFSGQDNKSSSTYNDYNACFLYGDRNYILKYNDAPDKKYYDIYVNKSEELQLDGLPVHSFDNYSSMQTHIYPIVTNRFATLDATRVYADRRNIAFIWNSEGLNYKESESYYNMKFQLDQTDPNKALYLKLLINNETLMLPTFKLSTIPVLNGMYKIYPIYLDKDNVYSMYKIAGNSKEKAKKVKNKYEFTSADLEHYCIFNTNLLCLKHELGEDMSGIDTYRTKDWVKYYTKCDDEINRYKGEETFYEYTLNLYDSVNNTGKTWFDYTISNPVHLPRADSVDYSNINIYFNSSIGTSGSINNIYNHIDFAGAYHGSELSYYMGSQTKMKDKTIDGHIDRLQDIYRGLAIGTVWAKEKDSVAISNPTIAFYIGSTPGFIKAFTEKDIFKLELINYKNSLQYLYANKPIVSFKNGLPTSNEHAVVTVNYLGYGSADNDTKVGTDSNGSVRAPAVRMATNPSTMCEEIYGVPSGDNWKYNGYNSSFKTQFYGDNTIIRTEPYNTSVSAESLFTTYNQMNANCLGLTKKDVNITIPLNYSNFKVITSGNISPKDYVHTLYNKNYGSNRPFTDTVWELTNKSADNIIRAYETIETQHILTSVTSNLFVNQEASKIRYNNNSDYQLDSILANAKGLYMSKGTTLLPSTPNIELDNLLEDVQYGNWTKKRPSEFKDDYKTSFYNEAEFYLINAQTNTIKAKIYDGKLLEKSLYAFNFNYVNKDTINPVSIKITLVTPDKQYICPETTLLKNGHVAVFYTNKEIKVSEIQISFKKGKDSNFVSELGIAAEAGNAINIVNLTLRSPLRKSSIINTSNNNIINNVFATSDIAYMRNFGLFKIDFSDISKEANNIIKENIEDINFEEGSDIYWLPYSDDDNSPEKAILLNIVFPLAFCFEESIWDGSKTINAGCLDETYSGFLMLPLEPNQRMSGVYYLLNDTKGFFVENKLPVEIEYIYGADAYRKYVYENIFLTNQIVIRHQIKNED